MKEKKIEIKGLHKAFGKKVVLDGVDIDIKKGDVITEVNGNRVKTINQFSKEISRNNYQSRQCS